MIFAVLGACCIFFMPLAHAENIAPGNQIENRSLPVENLRQLLVAKDFKLLNSKIDQLQKDFEKDFRQEGKLTSALYDFELNNPKFKPLLDEWAAKTPNDFAPFLCRGVYSFTRGANARGARYTSETSATAFESMEQFNQSAIMDFREALELRPTLIHPYAYLIRISSVGGDREDQKQYFNFAIKMNPYSILLRQVYLSKLAPRWGGSLVEMQAVVEESREHIQKYPQLRIVESELDIEAGMQAIEEKDYAAAISHLTKAISKGESAIAYFRRGQSYMYNKQHALAVCDFNRAIALNPTYIMAHEFLLSCDKQLKQAYPVIKADLDRLLELSPKAEYYYQRGVLRGWYLEGETEYAASDLEEATKLAPANKEYKDILAAFLKMQGERSDLKKSAK